MWGYGGYNYGGYSGIQTQRIPRVSAGYRWIPRETAGNRGKPWDTQRDTQRDTDTAGL